MCKTIPILLGLILATSAYAETARSKASPKGASNPPVEIRSGRKADSVDRVTAVVEVGGTVKATSQGKIAQSKIDVQAHLLYDERTLQWAATEGRCQSIRHYDRAEALIKVEQAEPLKPKLRPQRCLIGAVLDGPKATLFSPQGHLTRDELDLVDILGNSLLVDQLLPDRPVRQGERWTHANSLAAALLGLDAISSNTLASTLTQADDKSALIEMTGQVEGAAAGVTSQIEIKAKYRFNLVSRRIDWFGLLVRENRDVGHVAQGVDVIARLRMQIQPIRESDDLTDAALADLPRVPNDDLVRLAFEPASGGWKFLHDRRWFVTGNDHDLGVLRYVDRGDLVAQCNVAPLAPVEPGKQATLEKFQASVQKALGENFKEFVSAGQRANEKNYRVLEVVVRGVASDLPVQWRYYLVADRQGRQVAFTFTVEDRLIDQLGKADAELVRSFEFADREVAMNATAMP